MSTIVKELLRNYYNVDDASRIDLGRAIQYLIESNRISNEERVVLKLTIEQVSHGDIVKAVNLSSSSTKRRLNTAADKIAEFLGEEYQDSKIIKEVETRLGRKLEVDEETFCWGIIKKGRGTKGISIFNFRIKNGRVVTDEDKTEG